MGLFFEAIITLDEMRMDHNKIANVPIKAALKKHSLCTDTKYSDVRLKRTGVTGFELVIANPDGCVDEIHEALKDIAKIPFVHWIEIKRNHYSHHRTHQHGTRK